MYQGSYKLEYIVSPFFFQNKFLALCVLPYVRIKVTGSVSR